MVFKVCTAAVVYVAIGLALAARQLRNDRAAGTGVAVTLGVLWPLWLIASAKQAWDYRDRSGDHKQIVTTIMAKRYIVTAHELVFFFGMMTAAAGAFIATALEH